MSEVTIVCCTHGRAGQVQAFRAFGDDVLLSVADSQLPAYKAAYPTARFDPHSDDIVGLPAKKQHLLKKFGNVFWIDDDCAPLIDHTDGSSKVEPARTVALVHRLADQAREMGAHLFGFGSDVVPMHFQPQRPFALTGMLGGGKFGVLEGSELWYPDDPAVGIWEDLWLGALNAYHHRYCLIDLRYVLPTIVGQEGGLANLRTDAVLWAQADRMVELFGDAIKLKAKGDVTLYPWRLAVPW